MTSEAKFWLRSMLASLFVALAGSLGMVMLTQTLGGHERQKLDEQIKIDRQWIDDHNKREHDWIRQLRRENPSFKVPEFEYLPRPDAPEDGK